MFHHLCSRTTQCPEGDGTFDREVEGNRFVSLSCRFIEAAMQNGVWWSLENPRASLMWAVPWLATILKKPSVQSAFLVYCRFGSQFMKRTRIAGTVPQLQSLSCKCSGGHTHLRIQGSTRHEGRSILVSKLAAQYPSALCEKLVELVAVACSVDLDPGGGGSVARRRRPGPRHEL